MVYKWYILPIGGLYATYHLLGEPETTIDPCNTLDKRNNESIKDWSMRLEKTYIHPRNLIGTDYARKGGFGTGTLSALAQSAKICWS